MKAKDSAQQLIYKIINPFIKMLIKMKVTPNVITTVGLIINIIAVVVFIIGGEKGATGDLSYIGWGCGLILFAGLFDMIDGRLARVGNMSSRFGALYDSVLDRYSELFMFFGICYYLVAHHYFLSSIFAFVALIGSMMVSYVRARAEGLNIECKGGLMQRPERVVTIGLSGVICGIVSAITGGNHKLYVNDMSYDVIETISIFTIPILIVAVMSNLTAIKRLNYCRLHMNGEDNASK
ncbi:CDP-alcohol phosphatidyltransferase [Paludibacter propionicigenes WB4]|uniref:CDP-alcohol phosphatidyltransferase n=1 Tax=Paludibacter propionicigenes (strain DSM 17365 / JCM 13257 / WB4) TaxID=694427 RepID=E4T759_PALPW|nr:CDP-alcohol phosphatidyltransferase family protein [Paludibacter propionicigenes]ADQ80553.1 CDP-alcohol phosphatidyltransferase [Paludibacter propionicigenes WB4]